MAGLFKTLVDGISSVSGMVTANINPYKVQVVKPEAQDRRNIVKQDQYVGLYKRPGCFECIFANPAASTKYFSIFRLTNEGEALAKYSSISKVLSALANSSSSLYMEDKIQAISDCVRIQPTWSVAHVAAHTGLFEAFKYPDILSLINNVNSASGVTPIMAAVMGEKKQCVQEMLVAKARLDMADVKGDTVYHHAVRCLPAVIDVLIEHDTLKVYNWLNGKGESPLYLACLLDTPRAVEMLIDGGVDAGITNTDRFPVHVAVQLSAVKCIEFICKKQKSQLEARDKKHGGTPLHWAKTRAVTELLLELGGDVNAVSKTRHTPLDVMLMKDRTECLMELLCYGADCNIGNVDGDTPLHIAIQRDDMELVQIFIVFGANVNLKNYQNQSPRHLISVSSKSKHKDTILHMLHVTGAKRCDTSVKGCMSGCSIEGSNNGKPDDKTKHFFNLDKAALFDEMLCSAVSCSAMMKHEKSEAVLDMTDAPTDVGDRVLCLDGGGIRGLVLIQLLLAIEEEAQVPIIDCFDWIGGTSTGGLLALGLAVGKPLSYMKGLYFRLKDQVFKGSRPYASEPFENLLQREFGDRVMTDIKDTKVIVTGVLADRFPAELHLFRSYTPTLHTPTQHDVKDDKFEPVKPPHEQLIWQCARCTGAAPTFFRTFSRFIDGGMIANNPTLDILTEIHEYNSGLKFRNEPEKIRPLGVVVSLGCGRVPVVPRQHIDIFRPEGIFEAHKVVQGTRAFFGLLIDQATISEGRPVDRSRAWCSMINVPFYRFSPKLSADIPLDCNDNATLISMIWEAQCYIVANKHRIQNLAELLRAGYRHRQ